MRKRTFAHGYQQVGSFWWVREKTGNTRDVSQNIWARGIRNTSFWPPSSVGGRNTEINEHEGILSFHQSLHTPLRYPLITAALSYAQLIFPFRSTAVEYQQNFRNSHSWAILRVHKAVESLYRAAAFHVTENNCQLRCTRNVSSFVRLYRNELARWNFWFNLSYINLINGIKQVVLNALERIQATVALLK